VTPLARIWQDAGREGISGLPRAVFTTAALQMVKLGAKAVSLPLKLIAFAKSNIPLSQILVTLRHVSQRRLESAKAMIATGSSLSEIAFNCRFSSQSSFTRAFRRATGTMENAVCCVSNACP
jgi:AraC-like DNA-binding protein